MRLVTLAALVTVAAAASAQSHDHDHDHTGHDRHHHRHNDDHPVVDSDPSRFTTSRESPVSLPLPTEEDAFFFVVFGDRTGGPDAGVAVLADAVRDTNLLEPDLVMTVGDLIQGYNQTDAWMEQMREYKSIMDALICPWFPVAGNHDVYWRGPDKPENEHEANYEMHFGPLWYAFEHKNSWFISLYSDEGDPSTGVRDFRRPASQRMSDEQFAWLDGILTRAAGADHVFLFIHHPRWLGGQYGEDWDKVHARLVEAGNVTAVFAGHIHRMRSDPRDGIEYVTLATVGGYQNETVPEAGWLHQFHIVTVRPQQVALAAVPVGEVMDVREITGELANAAAVLAGHQPDVSPALTIDETGAVGGEVELTWTNPVDYAVDITLTPESGDSRWRFAPDHAHGTIGAGGSRVFRFGVVRDDDRLDQTFRPALVRVDADLLAPGFRYSIPSVAAEAPLDVRFPAPTGVESDLILALDGDGDCLRVPDRHLDVPDGPLTVECWFNADSFPARTGLLCKTESSEFGIFVNRGVPEWDVFLDGRYVEVRAPLPILRTGRWHHIAGVYDGAEARLYVDGERVAAKPASGLRRANGLPLYVGADVDGRGEAVSFFPGRVDHVRISTIARYAGKSFDPPRSFEADGATRLLLDMDAAAGPFVRDGSSAGAHGDLRGGARLIER